MNIINEIKQLRSLIGDQRALIIGQIRQEVEGGDPQAMRCPQRP